MKYKVIKVCVWTLKGFEKIVRDHLLQASLFTEEALNFFFPSFFQKFWLIPNHPKLMKEVRLEPKCFFFIYLFLGVLGLCCCAQAFSSNGMWKLLSRCSAWASHCGSFSCCKARALGAWTWVVVAHGLSGCRTCAQLLHGMWNLPGPGIEPMIALCWQAES